MTLKVYVKILCCGYLFCFLVSCQSLKPEKIVLTSNLTPRTHVLIMGGGFNARGNQVSLEKNVLFIEKHLKSMQKPFYTLFANGNTSQRSLQYKMDSAYPTPFQKMLISCFVNPATINLHYRPHRLQTKGPLRRVAIDRYFKEYGSQLKSGDKLVCYYTGHGGKGLKNDGQNTSLHLWHDGVYRMKDFGKKIQGLPKGVDVVLVMVQCYSGGFQNVIFNDGDHNKGLSQRNVSGFFATVYNRISAGCTPEVNEKDYQEYSTWFWSALFGEDRSGKPVVGADYDGDGQVSFSEAHAYTIEQLDSVDVPSTASELLLRSYIYPKSVGRFRLSKSSPIADLLRRARPSQQSVIKSLLAKTKKPSSSTISFLSKQAAELVGQSVKLKKKYDVNKEALKKLKAKVAKLLRFHYPELLNSWHVSKNEIFRSDDKVLIDLLYGNQEFLKFEALYKQQQSLQQKLSSVDRRWVYMVRLIRHLENVLYEACLMERAPSLLKQKYLQMRSLEDSSL